MKTPRTFRPKRTLLVAVAPLLESDAYLTMSEKDFVGTVMRLTGGSQNPISVGELYKELREEAGV